MKIFIFYCILLSFLSLSSCIVVKPVQVTNIDNFRTEKVLTKPELLFDVSIQNPNNFGVRVSELGVNLFVGDRNVIGLNIVNSIKVQRKNSVNIPVTLHPSINDIASLLNSEFNNLISGKSNQKMEIRGEIVMKKFIFTKRIKIKESFKL